MGKQSQKQLYLAAIIREFEKDFKEESLNNDRCYCHPWQSEEAAFKAYVEKQLGLKFVEVRPDSLNCDRYWIAKYDYDEDGFMIQKNICIYRKVIGVYGGCLVQLKDENGKELASLGRIR